jgi:uncharacterized protein with HEPN domain
MVHDDLGVDTARIWNIIEKEIPVLKRSVHKMLD